MKQHYIPRCYLKRFSDNEKSIYAYDKINSKSYLAPLMSVCCEDVLYTISEEFVQKNNKEGGSEINCLSIEKDHFAHTVEPFFAQLLNQIDEIKGEWISGENHYRLNFYEKRELALHIVTQYFRMPNIMESIVDDFIRMEKAEMDMIKHILAVQTGNDEFNKLYIEVECDRPVLHANLTYLNDESLMNFADAIANNIFVFWISKENAFYTSDFPIVVKPHVKNVRSTFMGLAQYGGELTMPLSPDLALSIYDREFFKDKANMDCGFVVASDKEVAHQNILKYVYAKRHIFSIKNDFSFFEFLKNNMGEHPFLTPNHKTEIVSGLGRY